jgi:23S rRNA A1618 N6-methylase RlmF
VLLKNDFGLDVELPPGHLVPTIPNRIDYICWIRDLISESGNGDVVKGIDMYVCSFMLLAKASVFSGTGASCIYPLLICKLEPTWTILATGTLNTPKSPVNRIEIDNESERWAQRNIDANKLQDRILIQKINNPRSVLAELSLDSFYDFLICNPPFYMDSRDIQECEQKKGTKSISRTEYTQSESIFPGGELKFIQTMFTESLHIGNRIGWYSSLIGKKSTFNDLMKVIKVDESVKQVRWTRFKQGSNTCRWAIAWTFKDSNKKRKAGWEDEMLIKLNELGIKIVKVGDCEWKCRASQENTWNRRARRSKSALGSTSKGTSKDAAIGNTTCPPTTPIEFSFILKIVEGQPHFHPCFDISNREAKELYDSLQSHLRNKIRW